jgi:ribosomal protein S18 acetylase RimI-like enzyme
MGLTTFARDAVPPGSEAPRLVRLRRLDWDSSFFGHEMGVVEVAPLPAARTALRRELRRELSASGQDFAHLILRANADDRDVIRAAEACGMRLVDVGIDSTLAITGAALPTRDPADRVRPFASADLAELRAIAATSFVSSRFAADAFFTPDQVSTFHETWVTNLCGGLAQAVLVYDDVSGALGFVACSLSEGFGRIVLIATAARARRRGIGRVLTHEAVRYFASAGATAVQVKTQAQNYAALALYADAGFRVSRAELTFSLAASQRSID